MSRWCIVIFHRICMQFAYEGMGSIYNQATRRNVSIEKEVIRLTKLFTNTSHSPMDYKLDYHIIISRLDSHQVHLTPVFVSEQT